MSFLFGFFVFQSGALKDVAQQNPIRFLVIIQVHLSFLFWFFVFQSGALKDVAQQNPIRFLVNIQVHLSFLFWFFVFQSGALKDVAQQNPILNLQNEVTLFPFLCNNSPTNPQTYCNCQYRLLVDLTLSIGRKKCEKLCQ